MNVQTKLIWISNEKTFLVSLFLIRQSASLHSVFILFDIICQTTMIYRSLPYPEITNTIEIYILF